jgi:hypothetical protein
LVGSVHDFKNQGLGMKIFLVSDSMLLPLTPTIAGTIANYLELMCQEVSAHLSENCVNTTTKLGQDLFTHRQLEESIRLVPTSQYQYVSAIAHRLAAKFSLTPLEICQNFLLPVQLENINQQIKLELDFWYNEAGYIYFQLTQRSIALWLDSIQHLSLDFDQNQNQRLVLRNKNIDLAIYAHARSCSLLQLAHQEQLIALTNNWQVKLLKPPILSCAENWFMTELKCIFEHTAEQQLIQSLMTVLDAICADHSSIDSLWQDTNSADPISPNILAANLRSKSRSQPPDLAGKSRIKRRSPNWQKLTIDLAQNWLEFYRHCRVFGTVRRQNPRLAVARCGLTAISRRYLQILLVEYFEITALVEL